MGLEVTRWRFVLLVLPASLVSGTAVCYIPTLDDEFDSGDPAFIAAAVNYVRAVLASPGTKETR